MRGDRWYVRGCVGGLAVGVVCLVALAIVLWHASGGPSPALLIVLAMIGWSVFMAWIETRPADPRDSGGL